MNSISLLNYDVDLENLKSAKIQIEAGDYIGAKTVLLKIVENTPNDYEKIIIDEDVVRFEYWNEEEIESFLKFYSQQGGSLKIQEVPSVYPPAFFQLAFLEIEDGNIPLAVEYLTRILSIEADQPLVYIELAAIFSSRKDHDSALALYEKALTIRPFCGPLLKGTILRGKGVQMIELGKLELAESFLNESLMYDPQNKRTLDELTYIQMLKEGAPPVDLEISVSVPRQKIPFCCQCGKPLLIGKDKYTTFQEKEGLFYLCGKCEPMSSKTKSLKALELEKIADRAYQEGDFILAIEVYSKILETDPKNAKLLSNRGLSLLNIKEYDLAVSDCTRVIEIEPGEVYGYFNRGIALYELGQVEKAFSDFEKVINLVPNQPDGYLWRGLCLEKLKHQELAILDYSMAIKLKPDEVGGYINRAKNYYQGGKFDKAQDDLDRALVICPHSAKANFLAGRVHDTIGEAERAYFYFDQAVNLDPENIHYQYFKAKICNQLGDSQEAIIILDKLLESRLSSEFFSEAYQLRGAAYMDLGLNEKALADFENAISIQASLK